MENSSKYIAKDITEKRFNDIFLVSTIGGFCLNVKKLSILNSVYNTIMSFCFYSVFVAELLEACNSSDLRHSMRVLRVMSLHTYVVFVELNYRFRRNAFYNLFKLTEMFKWEDLPHWHKETGSLTIAGWLPRIQKILRKSSAFFVTFHFLQRLIAGITEHELMYVTWYPFDASVSPTFEIVYFTQILMTILIASIFHTFFYSYCILVCIACSELENLQYNLLDIKQKHKLLRGEAESHSETEYEMQKELNTCVEHHQKIIRYLDALESTMNLPICGMLFVLQVSLCIAAFSVITSWGDFIDILQCALLYVVIMMLVSTYCVLGSLLTEKYECVGAAAWESDWVGAPVSYQRSILLIISKSTNEFALTAGKFVPLSNSTMMNMLNQSLSLFMFLLTMKDKN
ncbi:odorant receptor 4-like [Periplaneta americana]|uniref:odorant receptor 4-like n=1 Tax=Periplaneta americana TaxID=6978 RepID=UPI0037E86407